MPISIVIIIYNKLELEYLDQKLDIGYGSPQSYRSTSQLLEMNSLTEKIQSRDIK